MERVAVRLHEHSADRLPTVEVESALGIPLVRAAILDIDAEVASEPVRGDRASQKAQDGIVASRDANRENKRPISRGRHEAVGITAGEGEGLLTQHAHAAVEKCGAHRLVQMVWRTDHHHVRVPHITEIGLDVRNPEARGDALRTVEIDGYLPACRDVGQPGDTWQVTLLDGLSRSNDGWTDHAIDAPLRRVNSAPCRAVQSVRSNRATARARAASE